MGTVSKALDLLDLFTRQRPLIGLSDIARLSGANKATCHRMLTELAEYGLVEQIGTGREYRLGPALLRLAALREAHVPMRDAAMPVLQALSQKTGETTHLSLLMGDSLRTLAFAYSTAHVTRVTMEDAETLPFNATSSGLAALSFQPDSFIDRVLAKPMVRMTPSTETDPTALRTRIAEVRARGFAESHGGYQADVHSLAVPLFDGLGRCSGSLAVAAIAARMSDTQRHMICRALMDAGSAITSLWGGSLPPALGTLWRNAA